MPEAAAFTPEEQKYFDTKGADGPANDGTPAAPDIDPAVAEPVKAAEPVKEPDKPAEPDDKDNPGKFVRLAALHEERERRRELTRALEQERIANAERNARLEERLNFLARQAEPAPQPADPIQTLQELNEWKQKQEAEKQQAQQVEQQRTAFYAEVTKRESQFAQEHPDYYEAVEFAKQARVAELKAFGIFDETRIANILEQDIHGISVEALQRGGNPAEVFYNFARHRGFKAPTPAQQKPDPAATAADKLKTIAQGQNAGKSLGAAAGSATPQLTLENLANMSDDEFRKIALNKTEWRKLMGG